MKGEAFVKLPRHVIESQAWRSLSINARRFVDFLMLEHMRHAGTRNGKLLAPRRQLEAAGMGARHISAAIAETTSRGLVLMKRSGGRRPNTYALGWLPLFDGSTLERPWLAGAATSEGKSQALTSHRIPHMLPKGSTFLES